MPSHSDITLDVISPTLSPRPITASTTKALMAAFVVDEDEAEAKCTESIINDDARSEPPGADIWTKLTTFCDAIGSLMGTGYWVGQGIDSYFVLPEFAGGLSTPAIVIGFSISFFTTMSSSYVHYILNTNHQKKRISIASISPEDAKAYALATQCFIPQDEAIDLEKINRALKVINTILPKYKISPEAAKALEPVRLTWWQKFLVGGDAISHLADNAATPAFIYNLAVKNPTPLFNAGMQTGAILFGIANSKAILRTCINNLLSHNKYYRDVELQNEDSATILVPVCNAEHKEPEVKSDIRLDGYDIARSPFDLSLDDINPFSQSLTASTTKSLLAAFGNEDKPAEVELHIVEEEIPAPQGGDFWTKLTTFCDAIGSFVGTGYWIGQGIDSCLELSAVFAELSTPALAVGFSISLFTTISSAYVHYILNTNHQKTRVSTAAISPEDAKMYAAASQQLQHNESADLDKINHALKTINSMLEKYKILPEVAKAADPVRLTWWQRILVAGDAFGHVADNAATPAFIYNLAVKNPTPLFNAAMQTGATLFGILNSKAILRTCINNLLSNNEYHRDIALKDAQAPSAVAVMPMNKDNASEADFYIQLDDPVHMLSRPGRS